MRGKRESRERERDIRRKGESREREMRGKRGSREREIREGRERAERERERENAFAFQTACVKSKTECSNQKWGITQIAVITLGCSVCDPISRSLAFTSVTTSKIWVLKVNVIWPCYCCP